MVHVRYFAAAAEAAGTASEALDAATLGALRTALVDAHGSGFGQVLERCSLPLTGAGVVDLIITDLCVMSCDKENGGGLTLVEIAPGVTLDEIKAKTQAAFSVAPSLVKAA